MCSIKDLPPELLLEIFKYLPSEQLFNNIQNVCCTWRQVARDPSLWQDFVFSQESMESIEEAIEFVKKCPMLKHIRVYFGRLREAFGLEDFVFTVVKNCSDVRTFCVTHHSEFLSIPLIDTIFAAFPDLEFFEIKIDYRNSAGTVDRISKCTKLKKLKVRATIDYSDWVRPVVDGCVTLEYLNAWCSIPEDLHLYILENMKDRLKCVKFALDQPATQKAVNAYGSFTKLEYIRLNHYVECGRVDFHPLAKITTLKGIIFTSAAFAIAEVDTIFDVLFLSPFPLLEKLSIEIYRCDWGRAVLRDICHCYSNLKSLSLIFLDKDSMRDTFEDIHKLKQLETLVYQNSTTIKDEDTKYISGCSRLKHLDLQGCKQLTDETVVHITNCINLETLKLSYCSLLGQCMHLIPDCLPRLKHLDVHGNKCDRNYMYTVASKMPMVDVRF